MLFLWLFVIVFSLWTWKLNQHKIPGMQYRGGLQISYVLILIICSSQRSSLVSILGISHHYDNVWPSLFKLSIQSYAQVKWMHRPHFGLMCHLNCCQNVWTLRQGDAGDAWRPGMVHSLRPWGDQAILHEGGVNLSSSVKNIQWDVLFWQTIRYCITNSVD